MDKNEHAQKVNALFTSIATRYDLINDIQSLGLHRLWKQRIVNMSGFVESQKALDICCGTGDLVMRLACLGGRVVGLDRNNPMLAIGNNRIIKNNNINADLFQADALSLPFSDSSFNLITIAYGLRNLSDYQAGLQEALRVLKPEGRLLILDFGKPHNFFIRKLYYTYLKFILPVFGLFLCGNPFAYSYILTSLKKYPAQNGISSMLRQIGFKNIQVTNILLGTMSVHKAEKPL